MLNYRKIEAADDERIAEIIRANLEKLWPFPERPILTRNLIT